MALADLVGWQITVRCDREADSDAIIEALDQKLGRALAIIEDELRQQYGEVDVDRREC